jgi:hypothetical protein
MSENIISDWLKKKMGTLKLKNEVIDKPLEERNKLF